MLIHRYYQQYRGASYRYNDIDHIFGESCDIFLHHVV